MPSKRSRNVFSGRKELPGEGTQLGPAPDPGLVSPALKHSSSEFLLVARTRAESQPQSETGISKNLVDPRKNSPNPNTSTICLFVSNLCYINFLGIRKPSPKWRGREWGTQKPLSFYLKTKQTNLCWIYTYAYLLALGPEPCSRCGDEKECFMTAEPEQWSSREPPLRKCRLSKASSASEEARGPSSFPFPRLCRETRILCTPAESQSRSSVPATREITTESLGNPRLCEFAHPWNVAPECSWHSRRPTASGKEMTGHHHCTTMTVMIY